MKNRRSQGQESRGTGRFTGIAPAEGAEGCGSKPACAGLDVPKEQPAEISSANRKHGKSDGEQQGREPDYQSPNIFCLSSRRCCASSESVAVGRAISRPTPMGSPVSSQYP